MNKGSLIGLVLSGVAALGLGGVAKHNYDSVPTPKVMVLDRGQDQRHPQVRPVENATVPVSSLDMPYGTLGNIVGKAINPGKYTDLIKGRTFFLNYGTSFDDKMYFVTTPNYTFDANAPVTNADIQTVINPSGDEYNGRVPDNRLASYFSSPHYVSN